MHKKCMTLLDLDMIGEFLDSWLASLQVADPEGTGSAEACRTRNLGVWVFRGDPLQKAQRIGQEGQGWIPAQHV